MSHKFQEQLGKLRKACLKQNKDATSHYISQISNFAIKNPKEFEMKWVIEALFEEACDVDLYYRLALFRILEGLSISSLKTEHIHFAEDIKQNLETILSQLVSLTEDKEFSFSTGISAYFTDIRKIIKEFSRHFPDQASFHHFDEELQKREIASQQRANQRIEAMRRIEEEREKYKRSREKVWTKTYESQVPQVIPFDYQDHMADFEDAWERVSDWDDEDNAVCLHYEKLYSSRTKS